MNPFAKKPKVSLTNQILIATVLGLVLGHFIGPAIAPIKVVGDIFLRLIQMSVPIIILGAVTEAVGSINPKDLGKLGFKIALWFLIPTLIAAALRLAIGYIIQPGVGLPAMQLEQTVQPYTQSITTIITNFFPTNIIDSMAKGSMIQVIVFAMMLGVAISLISAETGDTKILDFVKALNVAVLRIIKIVMKTAPLGVGALMAWVAGSLGFQIIVPLAKYLGGMLLGVAIIMVVMILFTAAYVQVNPLKLAAKLANMTVVAATTTSSAISLPTKMNDSVNKLGVSERISGLVNPLGMVLNSTGQAMFLSLAAVLIAQFFHIDMPLPQMIQVVMLATLACMGTLAVPGGALVILPGSCRPSACRWKASPSLPASTGSAA
ncbi:MULTISPECIES: dicarboxylate/amino acid:cation symporter [Jonquetella]|uniref:dicarboxylate/amino acid:cation symporter n=1 Tax=Jonquetella TaxID=428711 RepID=UPI0002FFA78B|nr:MULTISPECIES: dicarboxylate/amino acid:cation symporter [Jonquetella]ERL24663.1 transporter, dicarboxylate/amino acid:cation Na+/H+ symporter family protein [Jonquetella sp. BV3C21]